MKRSVFWATAVALVLAPIGLAGVRGEVPAKPLQLEASTDYEGATAIAVLKWRDQADNELGFEILRADNDGKFRVVGYVGANTDHYRDKVGKYMSGAFRYKVRAFNEAGKSEESNPVSVWF